MACGLAGEILRSSPRTARIAQAVATSPRRNVSCHPRSEAADSAVPRRTRRSAGSVPTPSHAERRARRAAFPALPCWRTPPTCRQGRRGSAERGSTLKYSRAATILCYGMKLNALTTIPGNHVVREGSQTSDRVDRRAPPEAVLAFVPTRHPRRHVSLQTGGDNSLVT